MSQHLSMQWSAASRFSDRAWLMLARPMPSGRKSRPDEAASVNAVVCSQSPFTQGMAKAGKAAANQAPLIIQHPLLHSH